MLQFVDSQHGWAANPQQLAATSDGGARWAEVRLPGDATASADAGGTSLSATAEPR
jgi:hypothetical protein